MNPSVLTQRNYQINCPNCGAVILFRAANTVYTVCTYCVSTITRDNQVLHERGNIASVFEDYSLLQIGTQGRFETLAFNLIGRLQYEANTGRWTEWLVLLDTLTDESTTAINPVNKQETLAILSEDNGSYVWMEPINQLQDIDLPSLSSLDLGKTVYLLNTSFIVSARHKICLIAAQGECGIQPILNTWFDYIELRSHNGQLLTVSYNETHKNTSVYLGKAIDLNTLQLSHLKDVTSTIDLQGQSFDCPHCGSAVTPSLNTTKGIVCQSCASIIDLSHGLGSQLTYALQATVITPQIVLGSIATIDNKPWQALGFQYRIMLNNNAEDESDDWEEYILYNAKLGFQFLINSSEGWSLVKPMTGVPKALFNGNRQYLNRTYRANPSYTARTLCALGEFYWPVQSNDQTLNQDFLCNQYRLNVEKNNQETIWSAGQIVPVKTVIEMFNISSEHAKHFKPDITPTAFTFKQWKWMIIILAILIIIKLLLYNSRKESCKKQYNPYIAMSPEEQLKQCLARYKTTYWKGSYSGFSTGGGGHK